VLRGDHDEAVLQWLVGWEEVAEHPLHCLRHLGPEQPWATPCRRTTSVASLHIVVERGREKLDRSPAAQRDGGLHSSCPTRRWSPARWPPDQERTTASRSGENERRERKNGRERDREWMGENHERQKKNLALGTARGTVQRESTRSVHHVWMLVIGRRREVRIGLLFL
jgi:hypothetical protein